MSQDNASQWTPSNTSEGSVKTPPAKVSSASAKKGSTKTTPARRSGSGSKQAGRYEGPSALSHPKVTDLPTTPLRVNVKTILNTVSPVAMENQVRMFLMQYGILEVDEGRVRRVIRAARDLLLVGDEPTKMAAMAVNRADTDDTAILCMALLRTAIAHMESL